MNSNYTKAWTFVLVLNFLLLILGYLIADRQGLFIGFVLALFSILLTYFFGQTRITHIFKNRQIIGADSTGSLEILQKLSAKLNIPTPELYIFQSRTVNGFTVSQGTPSNKIYISSEMIKRLTSEEIEAALALLLAKISEQSSMAYTIGFLLANTLLGIGIFLDQLSPLNIFRNRRSQEFFIYMFSPFALFILSLVIKEKSTSENDAFAAQLIDSRLRIGDLLWKLYGYSLTIPMHVPPCTSHLFLVNPSGTMSDRVTKKIFFSHPQIKERIKLLLGYFPA